MTSDSSVPLSLEADLGPLPDCVSVSPAFARRMPTQRALDALARIEPTPFGDLAEQAPSRILAFRALVRDYPHRDLASLWLHAYDVEVEITQPDPTDGREPALSPDSAPAIR
jgi:hypothetical protein